MIDYCCKCNLRWFERVVWRKMNCQKYTTLKWLSLGPIIVACQWNVSSPNRPACARGSRAKSLTCLLIHFSVLVCAIIWLLTLSVGAQRSCKNPWLYQHLGRIVFWSPIGSARYRRLVLRWNSWESQGWLTGAVMLQWLKGNFVHSSWQGPVSFLHFFFKFLNFKFFLQFYCVFIFYFFCFIYLFLLYNIVLVLPYININLPQVYTCPSSWTRLPPPSPYHTSGSSQCTSPKHPVSCIEPELAICFLYDIIHVLMPFSQIIPPSLSHRVQNTVLYICVSFAVSLTGLSLPSS